jgi:hypothetical protein
VLRGLGGILDQLFQAFVVDVRRRPLRDLVPWQVVPKLHVELVPAMPATKGKILVAGCSCEAA